MAGVTTDTKPCINTGLTSQPLFKKGLQLFTKFSQGSRVITLSATDGGKHSPYNLGNWVKAGFMLAK